MDSADSKDAFKVLMNHEEQYCLWEAHLPIPAGWHGVGVSGEKQKCLDYIKEVWTDMRPLSLRKQMAAHEVAASKAAE